MATPETRNEHIASVPRSSDPTDLDEIVPSYVTGLVITRYVGGRSRRTRSTHRKLGKGAFGL